MGRGSIRIAAVVAGALSATQLSAGTWTVDTGRSTFAVLTHKAGVAARLGHDHLVIAHAPRTALEFDPAAPERAKLSIVVPVQSLEIDAPGPRRQHADRLRVLGALSGELGPIEDDDRVKIRAAMLSPKQLFGERFGEIRAELLALEPRGAGADARVALGWNARVRIEVRGVAIEKTFPARFEVVNDGAELGTERGTELHAEVLGELRFTEFGIEPYSAALGAVKNADLFHLWVDLVATSGK